MATAKTKTAKTKTTKAMPKWKPAPEALVLTFEKALQSVPEAQPRKVFGYPAAFVNGQMLAGLHQEHMILRLSTDGRTQFQEREGGKIFEPMPGRPMREYVVVPTPLLKSEKQLTTWLGNALAYAKSLPPKVAKPKSKKKG